MRQTKEQKRTVKDDMNLSLSNFFFPWPTSLIVYNAMNFAAVVASDTYIDKC